MKKLFLIIILLYQFRLTSQTAYVLDNVLGLNLKFKISVDSVQNKYNIKCGMLLDSSTVNINGKTWNIDRFTDSHIGCHTNEKIFTFLYAKNFPDSLFTILDFYSGKLIQVVIYYKGDKRTEEIKELITRHFKLKEFTAKVSDKTTKVFWHNNHNKDGYNYLAISDKKAMDLMPSWCGNSSKRGSWAKLEKYL